MPIDLPTSGSIKFEIIRIKSPSYFAIKIIEHLSSEGNIKISYEQRNSTIELKLKEMQNYMNDDRNQIIQDCLNVGELYVFPHRGKWSRCKILYLRFELT